ncbi:hypothetical protein G5C66_00775 [Nocardioides sp. KC13]|uniref:Uncharacterized protein n=1 Tax=Nocardioides turkmenicus TaxID=2711220 RepID=A0A6M1QXX8_9ACTN|nr:hypothetical protein [Nocardioides sp. KC13]NGN91271.1 hypothetical protein [Nocardioides sp. KC13]
MTTTAERTDRVGLSVVAVVIVLAAEVVRSVVMDRLRWEVGYPEMFAVQGASMTLVLMAYAAVLIWRGRTLVRRLTAPLLVLPTWLSQMSVLVVLFMLTRGPVDLVRTEWWMVLTRVLFVISVVCPVVAWGVARRRGTLWLIGLLVPVGLAVGWLAGRSRLDASLPPQALSTDLVLTASVLVIPILGCLACWGIEALSRRRA